MDKGVKARWPTRPEVREQLKRITTSRTFENHGKLSDLLRALVLTALRGKQANEDKLGQALFDKPVDWVPMNESAVRERKRLMCKTLRDYYRTEGSEDLVVIEFPKHGRVKFYFNPQADAAQLVNEAETLMAESFPEVMERYARQVLNTLEECIKLYPSYAPAHAALAEVLLIYTACDEISCFPAHESIFRAQKAAQRAIELDARLWRGQVVSGVLHCCTFDWKPAEKAFHAAMEIDPERTSTSFFYIAYLEAVGRHRDADICVLLRKSVVGNGRFTWPIFALFEYLRGDGLDRGYSVLEEHSPGGISVRLDDSYRRGETILDFDFWVVSLLAACVCLSLGRPELAWRYAEQGVRASKAGCFDGLLVLTYAAHGKNNPEFMRSAEAYLEKMGAPKPVYAFSLMEEHPAHERVSTFSHALAYLGVGKTEQAIEKLREACDEGFPLMIFLHRWPLFDPLREHDGFKRLMARMNLPG